MTNFEDKSAAAEEDTIHSGVFKVISECSPNGIIVTDKDFNINYINATAERMTGVFAGDVINNYIYSVFPQIPQLNDKNKLKNSDSISINGKNLHTKVFSIKNERNDEFVVFMMQDISEEIKLTLELEKSYHIIKELEDILEGSFDGVLVTDGEGNVLLVNKSYERVTGITKEEMMGRNMKELINPIWMKNSVVFPVIESKKPVSLHHTTRYGKNIIVTGTPVFREKGKIDKIVVNARDISEIYELREELQKAREVGKLYFNNDLDSEYKINNKSDVVVASEDMKEMFSLANKVSNFDTTVLILGESGVGKDVVAKYIHANSLRRDKPFIVINCGAIPEHLLESELFGYEKGAFTGASKDGKMGLFEAARGGILFLDEIGEMSANLQVKLLRVLESREINRVGSIKTIPVDVRIIAATNRNLEKRVQTGEFREDLFYRLNVIQIKIPSLRERIQDIGPLSLYFLKMFNQKYGQNKKITYDVLKEFERYNWVGNVRQLKNTVENMVVVSNNEFLQINDLPWYSKDEVVNRTVEDMMVNDIMNLDKVIEAVEKQLLHKALEKYKSTRKIAHAIGVDQSTVVRKLKKYNLS